MPGTAADATSRSVSSKDVKRLTDRGPNHAVGARKVVEQLCWTSQGSAFIGLSKYWLTNACRVG